MNLPILERAEIHHKFRLLFERFEDNKISFGNYLIFNKNLYVSYKSTSEFTHVMPSENDIGQKILGLHCLHLVKDYGGNFCDKKPELYPKLYFFLNVFVNISFMQSVLSHTYS